MLFSVSGLSSEILNGRLKLFLLHTSILDILDPLLIKGKSGGGVFYHPL